MLFSLRTNVSISHKWHAMWSNSGIHMLSPGNGVIFGVAISFATDCLWKFTGLEDDGGGRGVLLAMPGGVCFWTSCWFPASSGAALVCCCRLHRVIVAFLC